MKRIILFISILTAFSSLTMAQSDAVSQANNLYTKADYTSAAKQYETILSNQGVAPELYFNLGNAYYKSNEIGRSILNYERALRLSPSYDDARFNLELAQTNVIDNSMQSSTFFLSRWIQNFIKMLTSNQWLGISVTLFVLTLILIFLFIFGSTHFIRKLSFQVAVSLLLVCLASFIFSGIRKDQLVNHREAIVMVGVVTVKSSPDKSGTDLFQLHEGTKVKVKSTLGNWTEIKLGNGNVGWVEQANIEKI